MSLDVPSSTLAMARRYSSALAQDECIPFLFGMQAGRQVSAKDADAVLRIVSAAVNGLWAVNPPALLSITLALASCVKALSLRPRVFAPLFTALIASADLMELHTLVILEAYVIPISIPLNRWSTHHPHAHHPPQVKSSQSHSRDASQRWKHPQYCSQR